MAEKRPQRRMPMPSETAITLGLYVHVPFCHSKCPYCDFYSIMDDSLKTEYVNAICAEMEQAFDGRPADTLYFGGGTPTLLKPEQIGKIITKAASLYGLEQAEITIEANPDTVDPHMLCKLRTAGCNRISFGMQSAVQKELSALGRSHTPGQLKRAVEQAKAAGFDNVSVDIMLGIPYQTEGSLGETLDFTDGLNVQHVSAYLLKIEPGTPFYSPDIIEQLPDDDEAASLYLYAVSRLEKMGFKQYEISNFSKSGLESRHNLKYWLCHPYLGFGPAAHSFTGNIRYGHSRDIKVYLKHGLYDRPHIDTKASGWDETLMLGLRLNRGVDLANAERCFDFDKAALLKKASKYRLLGLMEITNNTIRLTPKGFLVSNNIIVDLLGV